jgi:hypothetical protein
MFADPSEPARAATSERLLIRALPADASFHQYIARKRIQSRRIEQFHLVFLDAEGLLVARACEYSIQELSSPHPILTPGDARK